MVTRAPTPPSDRRALIRRADRFPTHWSLRTDGPYLPGITAPALPVPAADGTPAALKPEHLEEECAGEATTLLTRAGGGAVHLPAHDPPTGTLLLERLDGHRPLSALPGAPEAVDVLGALPARLTARPAPPGLRRPGDLARGTRARRPRALPAEADPGTRRLPRDRAAAPGEAADERGDRLPHRDPHHGNVLAAARAAWPAIGPEPPAGDPGFEPLPRARQPVRPGGHPPPLRRAGRRPRAGPGTGAGPDTGPRAPEPAVATGGGRGRAPPGRRTARRGAGVASPLTDTPPDGPSRGIPD
ncbi:aminoglycoside phosphotransferase family protein [Streptomyces griseoluteus]|uniref:aminoglycoside phosphotransferase family protein n=1 Tax=Streptomyces griseoluteus TaxID=29306 RepID=UPI0037F52DBE